MNAPESSYYDKNKEAVKAYREKHKEEIKSYQKAYYQGRDKQKERERNRANYLKRKAKLNCEEKQILENSTAPLDEKKDVAEAYIFEIVRGNFFVRFD